MSDVPVPAAVTEALGDMLQQVQRIQSASTDAERNSQYDVLQGMLADAQKRNAAAAVPPASLSRAYSNPAVYSPGLAQQPAVPDSGDTRVYAEFVAAMPSQAGKTAFVTGANTGLGFYAAKALAKRGATVVLLCRSAEKADAARREMLSELGGGAAVETAHLDLSSLASVRECAAALRGRHARCDLLLLNAGVMGVRHDLTEDGHDVQMQTNHLGHFLLAHELTPLLLAAGGETPARVVSHSSNAHWVGWPSFSAAGADGPVGGGFRFMPFGLASWLPGSSRWARYGQSKLCNILFTAELQRRLASRGEKRVVATVAHPGAAVSQLFQVAAGAGFMPGWQLGERLGVAQSCADGSTPLLLAATGTDVVGGEYFGPANGIMGAPRRDAVRGYGKDEAMARELWAWSERACGVHFGGWE